MVKLKIPIREPNITALPRRVALFDSDGEFGYAMKPLSSATAK